MRDLQKQKRKKNGKKYKRLFFAIIPDNDTITALLSVQNKLTAAYARILPPENFHLTLVFIGNSTIEQQQCLDIAAHKIRADTFSVHLDKYGYFPKQQIFWIGLSSKNSTLMTLHQHLNQSLVTCGFQPQKKFLPHITLLRKSEMVTPHGDIPSVRLYIDRFFLIQSVPTKTGVRYLPLSEYLLNP